MLKLVLAYALLWLAVHLLVSKPARRILCPRKQRRRRRHRGGGDATAANGGDPVHPPTLVFRAASRAITQNSDFDSAGRGGGGGGGGGEGVGEGEGSDWSEASSGEGEDSDEDADGGGGGGGDGPAAASSLEQRQRKRRDGVLAEIRDSEQSYARSLGALVEVFLLPLRERASSLGVSKEQIAALFQNVEALRTLHDMLAAEMATARDPCRVLRDRAPFLKIYHEYVLGYERCLEVAQALKRNSRLQDLLARQRQDHYQRLGGNTIMSLLIMPVQRIPKYELLLRELLKHCPEGAAAAQRRSAEEALARVHGLAVSINERKRQLERAAAIVNVQNTLVGLEQHLLEPHRFLVRQGPLHVREEAASGAFRPCLVVLFNDALLWARLPSNRFEGFLHVRGGRVAPAPPGTEGGALAFQLLDEEWLLQAKATSRREADEWCSAFEDCVRWCASHLPAGYALPLRRAAPPPAMRAAVASAAAAAAAAAAGSREHHHFYHRRKPPPPPGPPPRHLVEQARAAKARGE